MASDCQYCDPVAALDARIDQRFIDLEKRTDERYVNQKDYNTIHNSLQREISDNAKITLSKEDAALRFGAMSDRIAKLERWPWVLAGLFSILVTAVALAVKFL